MNTTHKNNLRIAIIGTGFSGLCAAIQLKLAGFSHFTVYEKGDDIGGVWRANTYPGAACDVFWHLYSYSFEPGTGFTCPYPEQAEIQGYQRYCAEKYNLYPHIQFNTEVESLVFDEAKAVWHLTTKTGELCEFDAVISGVGQLSRPKMPTIQGMDTFKGHSFHSAEWDHDYPLAGKKVAVIGTGASAIQFIPRIAPEVAQLDVFQRSAPYLLPRFQRDYSTLTRWVFKHVPWYRNVMRNIIFQLADSSAGAFLDQSRASKVLKQVSLWHLHRQIKDPVLRKKLTPDYPVGCKRVLFASDYFPTYKRDNVNLVTQGIERITEKGVVTSHGTEYEADVIIYGTGFHATEFLAPMAVRGRNGLALEERWAKGAEAYLGITVDAFPNLFLCYGPNTNLGGNSIIYMIECQVNYIMQCLQSLAAGEFATMEVRQEVIKDYNIKLTKELDKTVWSQNCTSWYHNAEGKITNNWPGTNERYRDVTKTLTLKDYRLRQAGSHAMT